MRIARLTLAAAVAASTLAFVPGAQADQQQIICRGTRWIYTSDYRIEYPYFYLCPA